MIKEEIPEVYRQYNDIIAARRQLIRDEARCTRCGTTQRDCKAGWGTDDPGPEDLCCTLHCNHRVSVAEMDALMEEIASGRVRTVKQVLASRPKRDRRNDGKPVSVTARFDQGEWWRKKTGDWVRIADMSPGHRYNTAAMLMRGAAVHASRYAWGFASMVGAHDGGEMAHESLERALDDLTRQTRKDPRGWLRETALYRALTAGPPPYTRACEVPDCGCSGEAHA